VGSWIEGLVRSKVVRLEEITDVQYGGVAEKFSDFAVNVDFVTTSCVSVWDEDAEKKENGVLEKFSVRSIDCKGDVEVDTPNAEMKNEKNTEKHVGKSNETWKEKKIEKKKIKIQKETRREKRTENGAETRKERKPEEKRNNKESRNDVEAENWCQVKIEQQAEDGRQRSATEYGRQRNAV